MGQSYEDFLLIVGGGPGGYTVEAHGPAEIRVAPLPFEYQETPELREQLDDVERGFAPSRERMQSLGALLFNALFPRPIFRAFERAHAGLPASTSLRLRLLIRPPELSTLPWELLYDPDEQLFLGVRHTSPIVRVVESGRPAASTLAPRPLRVLYLQSNPPLTMPLNLRASEEALREGLGPDAVIRVLREATPAALRDALRDSPGYHILHYDGHAEFDRERGVGSLVLHGPDSLGYQLSGEMLASYLNGTSVRLVVLSACQTAVESGQRRFSGIAQQLMGAGGLPAVVAMQFAIPDASAVALNRELYRALADGAPIEAAVVAARHAILERMGADTSAALVAADWATPVLYLRSKDGNILREQLAEEPGMSDDRRRDGEASANQGTQNSGTINTGGPFIGGGVNTGGGSFGGRDNISISGINSISGSQFNMGQGASMNISQGATQQDLASLFRDLYQKIEARPVDPDVDKEELAETVQKIEQEAARGEQANASKVERWLKNLADMAPDILEVTVACLTNPVAGVTTAIQKIAERARA